MTLLEIGFWRHLGDIHDKRPDPTTLVDHLWFQNHQEVVICLIDYLKHGFIESYEMGYSYCRFQCLVQSPKDLGACTLTDGVYAWPEGYIHYLENHFVRPPNDFVSHVMERYPMESRRWLNSPFKLLMWDIETNAPIPIPYEMSLLIVQNTNLETRNTLLH